MKDRGVQIDGDLQKQKAAINTALDQARQEFQKIANSFGVHNSEICKVVANRVQVHSRKLCVIRDWSGELHTES